MSRAAESGRRWPRVPGSELPVCKDTECRGGPSPPPCRIVQKPALGPGGGACAREGHPGAWREAPIRGVLPMAHITTGPNGSAFGAWRTPRARPASYPAASPRALPVLRKKTCGPLTTPDPPVGTQSTQSQPSSHSPWLGGQGGSKVSPPRHSRQRALSLSPLWGSLLLSPSCVCQPSPGTPLGHPSRPVMRDTWAGALLGHRCLWDSHCKELTSSTEVSFDVPAPRVSRAPSVFLNQCSRRRRCPSFPLPPGSLPFFRPRSTSFKSLVEPDKLSGSQALRLLVLSPQVAG